jgi:putative ABC transport system substrate-binding protein
MQLDQLKRRDFITLLGGAAAAWPLGARAQQGDRMRRIGVLMNLAADDPEGQARLTAFAQGLQQLGWTDGRNVRIDYRWGAGDAGAFHRYAEELLALAPDVILASGTPSVQALQKVTRTVPIVFALVADPVGAGWVESLARPGGNTTGFTPMEYGIGAKWLELLKEIDGASGPYDRPRPVGRYPGRGAVVRRGVEGGRPARCRRD